MDCYVFHQASLVALQGIAKGLNIPFDRLVVNLAKIGNLVRVGPLRCGMPWTKNVSKPGRTGNCLRLRRRTLLGDRACKGMSLGMRYNIDFLLEGFRSEKGRRPCMAGQDVGFRFTCRSS